MTTYLYLCLGYFQEAERRPSWALAPRAFRSPTRATTFGLLAVFGTEHLHTVVRGVRNVHKASFAINQHAVQKPELAVALALLAPHGQKVAVFVEHLDTVIGDLGDIDIVLLV